MKMGPIEHHLAPPAAVRNNVLHTYAHGRCVLRTWGRDSITDEVRASVGTRREHLMYMSQRYIERLANAGRVEATES